MSKTRRGRIKEAAHRVRCSGLMVGAAGFEPAASWSRTRCASSCTMPRKLTWAGEDKEDLKTPARIMRRRRRGGKAPAANGPCCPCRQVWACLCDVMVPCPGRGVPRPRGHASGPGGIWARPGECRGPSFSAAFKQAVELSVGFGPTACALRVRRSAS